MSLRRPLRAGPRSATSWTTAVERYRRALERYHTSLRLMPERKLRSELAELGGALEAVLEDFEDAADRRRAYDRDAAAAVLKVMHHAATLCSHATEAALLANEAAWRHDEVEVARRLDEVRGIVRTIDDFGAEVTP